MANQDPSVSGDEDAEWRQQLIHDHVDVAHNIARGLVRRYGWMLDAEDIDGCAMVGLCEAATRFDRSRTEPFVAFAEPRIRGAVFDEIRRLGMHGRIVTRRQRRISAARQAITRDGNEPTDARVAEYLGLSLAAVQDTSPRNTRVGGDEVAALPSTVASPQARIECAQFLAHLQLARDRLPEPNAAVIRLHYEGGLSLAQIARTLGLTLGRIRHLHAKGLHGIEDVMCQQMARGDARSLRELVSYPSMHQLESC